jgi:hypothetical protein
LNANRAGRRGRPGRTPASSDGIPAVELVDGRVKLADANDPDGPVLEFTLGEWEAFVGGVRLGEFEVTLLAEAGSQETGAERPA